MLLSIIIPTLNESATLSRTLAWIRRAAMRSPLQIIVSDCRSRDDTVHIARTLAVDAVIEAGVSRADALNRGAQLARADVLLFLHADSIPPVGFGELIDGALRDRRTVGGAFDFEFDKSDCARLQRHLLDWVVMCNRIRFRWTGNFYGDQSIFVRKPVFDRIGGFVNTPLLEDIYFSRRMKRMGRTAILQPPVVTSARRFLSRGVVRQFAQDISLLACDSIGLRPQRIWQHYNRLNHDAHETLQPGADDLRWGYAAT